MSYQAQIVADSMSPDEVRLTTVEVTFPRMVLAEFNTHRVLSRNSASSRAIPIPKRIEMVEKTPYVPDEFGSNQKGMQSGAALSGDEADRARAAWFAASRSAVEHASFMAKLGVHKEYANRLLEPFLWHTAIVTATEWENFYNLRCHPLASRPIRLAAELMAEAYRTSTPRVLGYGEWHLPYVVPDDQHLDLDMRIRLSVARCARVSYLTHDGKRDIAADLALYDRLASAGHMSPLEHAARPAVPGDVGMAQAEVGPQSRRDTGEELPAAEVWFGNFRGWVQHRKLIPGEAVFRREVEA